jgi:hypothetical protein
VTTVVVAKPPPGLSLPSVDPFAGITTATLLSTEVVPDGFAFTFDADLDGDTVAAIRRRVESRNEAEETLRARLQAAAAAFAGPESTKDTAEQLADVRAVILDLICVVLKTGEAT